MCSAPRPQTGNGRRAAMRAILLTSTAMLLGACSQQTPLTSLLAATPQGQDKITTGSTEDAKRAAPDAVRKELQKATEYWGNLFAKDPSNAEAGYNYARNLKAMGEKQQALGVLQTVAGMNPGHRGIQGEYGRLALEFDQVSLAEQLLEKADDPAQPDWRVISARGTAKAKQGLYAEAIVFYERARQINPEQPSILSNLALAYTMEGHPDKAEPLLRRAAAARNADARVNQNLSLVLGLQGKYDEAQLTAQQSVPADSAADNVNYVRKIVKVKAKPLKPNENAAAKGKPQGWSTSVVAAK